MTLQNTYKFNRFPIRRERFFALVRKLEQTKGFGGLFLHEPRVYEKVYVTVTDNELESLVKRLDSDDIKESFEKSDAIISLDAHVIILHVPAMVRKLSSIPSRSDDPDRRVLFTIHFFACLFHELAHAVDIMIVRLERMGDELFGAKRIKHKPLKKKRLEKFADDKEEEYMAQLKSYLDQKHITWFQLSEYLFDWNKLQRYVTPDN